MTIPRVTVLIVAALTLAACAGGLPPLADRAVETYYRDVPMPPPGTSRVYILPKITDSLFGGSLHPADILVGSDQTTAVPAGRVADGVFLAFDVPDGTALFIRAIPYGATTFRVGGRQPLFLRPVVPGADAPGWTGEAGTTIDRDHSPDGLAFERLDPFQASNLIQSWHMASLSTTAGAIVRQGLPAAGREPGKPVPADGGSGPAAAAGCASAANVEETLESLRRLHGRGLITRDEYDAKRREALRPLP